MFKRLFDREPLTVEVQEHRWDCYGNHTRRHYKLAALLQSMGGINESVPPGSYHFNTIGFGPMKFATLKPRTER